MSEFDKEAEREKLREQLEAEQEDREATQRMSELLLGGATMTGRHCENCASPVFRQNGREFCPNCNRAVGETAREQTGQEPSQTSNQQTPGQQTPEEAGQADRTVDAAGASQPRVEPTESIPEGRAEEPPRRQQETPRRQPNASRESVPSAGAGEVAGGSAAGDLGDARDALARKLTRLAAQAEATDDVGRARELLAATREAAEALAALDRVGDGA